MTGVQTCALPILFDPPRRCPSIARTPSRISYSHDAWVVKIGHIYVANRGSGRGFMDEEGLAEERPRDCKEAYMKSGSLTDLTEFLQM